MQELSGNFIKKCAKKQLRCQNTVEKDTGIMFTQYPTKNIVLCNAGLSNGLSAEIVIESFSTFGQIQNLYMLPGKSYCYIIYNNTRDAENAYVSCNGLLNIAQDKKPVYLGYALAILNLPKTTVFNERPPGLKILQHVISESEEDFFIKLVYNSNNTETNLNEHELKHRFVKHFGYEFKYDINNVDRHAPLDEQIPKECEKLYKFMDVTPDQLTVNCYKPGQGIPTHVDTHSAFEGPIVTLSLGSDIIMEFKHDDGRHYSVLLPRRSLTIMSGESRYNWTHGITPRKLDIIQGENGVTVHRRELRVSYTFRKINDDGSCQCCYPTKCDSQNGTEISEEAARKLENVHVQQVYENIASHFSDTRHKPWPNVQEFVNSFELGSIILDIGCGNGKNIGQKSNCYEIGCDNSNGLLNFCRDRNLEVFSCNCLAVPFRHSVADGIISIAVIHHLANESRRRQAVAEIVRILRIGGRALIYVWAKDQNRQEKSSYLKQDRKHRKSDSCIEDTTKKVDVGLDVSLPIHTNRKQFAEQDMLVPWKLKQEAAAAEVNSGSTEFLRFYHVFEEPELQLLCQSFDNINIIQYYYDQGNWCIIFEKIK